jgi:MoxR-like ATPase
MHDAETVRRAVTRARQDLVDREVLAEVVALCAVAGEHLLVIGPPGTAKSQVVRLVAGQLGGRYFEYLLGRFTEPNEVFGPVDLRRLREGVVEIETAGMLPEAEVAFLDEVFLGSTAILNTLLGILNERTFRRGSTSLRVPLRVCVGASNSLPEDPALAAFADRFLARVFVEPVADARLEELLESGWAASRRTGVDDALPPVTGHDGSSVLAALDRLGEAALRCDLSGAQGELASAVRRLRAAGVALTDRRAVRSQRLVAAAAVLDGRDHATPADLWVLPLVAPTADAQATARETLADLLAVGRNTTLLGAAEDLARGPAARADRLARTGSDLLAGLGAPTAAADQHLRVEATLREIDSAFDPEHLPPHLAEVRTLLIGAVQG